MFLPLIICIVLFTQTTKIWIYQATEVMAITASYNRNETLLDCFTDWQVYSWVTPLYAVILSSNNQIKVQTEKKLNLQSNLRRVLAFIPHHMEVAIMPWLSLLEFHSSTSSINCYTAMSLSNLYQKSDNCFPFRFMSTDNRNWTHKTLHIITLNISMEQ